MRAKKHARKPVESDNNIVESAQNRIREIEERLNKLHESIFYSFTYAEGISSRRIYLQDIFKQIREHGKEPTLANKRYYIRVWNTKHKENNAEYKKLHSEGNKLTKNIIKIAKSCSSGNHIKPHKPTEIGILISLNPVLMF